MTKIRVANLKETAEYNIENLEGLLNELYTVEIDGEFSENKTKKVNILDELYEAKTLSTIYEESLKNPSGKIYEQYYKYLEYTKRCSSYLNDLLMQIESENKDDISNAKRLIEQFKLLLTTI